MNFVNYLFTDVRGELSYLALLGSEKISAPYFKQCFFRVGCITPQTESNPTPPSPKIEITNILFYILYLWLRIYCSGLRGCDMHEEETVIWPCLVFHGRYYFYSLNFKVWHPCCVLIQCMKSGYSSQTQLYYYYYYDVAIWWKVANNYMFTLMFINKRKRNANTYLISNFDSLEATPSNLPP